MSSRRLSFVFVCCCSLSCLMVSTSGAVGLIQFQQFGTETLRGTVTTERYPVSGAKITVKNDKTGKTFERTSDKQGNFKVTGLEFGTYQVTVSVPGYESETRTAVVVPYLTGNNVYFRLVAVGDSNRSSIKGRIQDASARNLAGAKIQIVDDRTGKPYKVEANSEGLYEKDGLIPGSYRLVVTAAGYQDKKGRVQLGERDLKEVNFKLRRK